eukprot:1479478-Ditylum_brightwellii.AAC.1
MEEEEDDTKKHHRRFDDNDESERIMASVQVPLGSTQEWIIRNPHPTSGHPFHMHVNPFQIVSVVSSSLLQNNNGDEEITAAVESDFHIGDWRD